MTNQQRNLSLHRETAIRIERLLARQRSASSEPFAQGSEFSNALVLVDRPRRSSVGGPSAL